MRVQHPDKTEHTIAPAGQDPILTDERGIAEVDNKLGKQLLEQGWTRTDRGGSRPAAKAKDDEPEATTDDGDTAADDKE